MDVKTLKRLHKLFLSNRGAITLLAKRAGVSTQAVSNFFAGVNASGNVEKIAIEMAKTLK